MKKWGKTVLAASAALVVTVSPLTNPISVFAEKRALKSRQIQKMEVSKHSDEYNREQLIKDEEFKAFNGEMLSFEDWDVYYDGLRGTLGEYISGIMMYPLLDEEQKSLGAGIDFDRSVFSVNIDEGSAVDYVAVSQNVSNLIPNRTYTASGSFFNIISEVEGMVGIMLGEEFEVKDRDVVPIEGRSPVTSTADFVAQSSSERVSYFLEKRERTRMANVFQKAVVKEKYSGVWMKVDSLFTDLNHEELAGSVSSSKIEESKRAAESLSDDVADKAEMMELVSKAQGWFEEREAIKKVNLLFTDDSHNALKENIEQSDIDAAKEQVEVLPDSGLKTELNSLVIKAQGLFQERETTKKVDLLFTDDSHNILKDDIGQSDIDAARTQVEMLPDGELKTELVNLVMKAQELLYEREAIKKVDALFTNDSHDELRDEVAQSDIDAAKAQVDLLSNNALKAELTVLLTKSQSLFNVLEAARKSVNDLFVDSSHDELKDDVTQSDIDAAKAQVDALPSGKTKNKLTQLLAIAQSQFDTLELVRQVNALFIDDSHNELKDDVTQSDIDAAKVQVDALLNGTLKRELTELLTKAQQLLDERGALAEARAAVRALFTDDEQTELKAEVTQEQIDEASSKVAALPENEEKEALKQLIGRAQNLFDEWYKLSVPDAFNIGEDDELSGAHGEGIAKVRLWVNDVVKTQATTDGNGNYIFTNINRFISSSDDKVEVVGWIDVNKVDTKRVNT
ncbi:toxin Cry1Ac domain D-VI-related protein [Listeria valentina]|uniref:toxin Cry1Ac domain D-VI-related protein n=1 Tax=Listeria valentina TaxID=2705293 RepID=UPI001430CF86|nr:toxin Cry1Ac domain D-VI-related protein [Listeria valentina]